MAINFSRIKAQLYKIVIKIKSFYFYIIINIGTIKIQFIESCPFVANDYIDKLNKQGIYIFFKEIRKLSARIS